jgi:hypothetical protein
MHEEPRHKLTVKVLDSLRTIQGYTMEEYREARAELMDDLAQDLEAVQMAKNIGNVAGLQVAVAAPTVVSAPTAAAPPAWEEPAPAAPFQSATVPNCAHGPMTARSGTSAKGPWKAWMCPTAKGTPGQCSPNFLNRGTPEFNNFPA